VVGPLDEIDVRLVAVSPDQPSKLRETLKKKELEYTLLSDSEADGARAFGIAWKVGDADYAKLASYGIDLEDASGETHHVLPVPSIFLIDATGTIRFRYSNPDYKVRLENEKLVEAARGLVSR